MAADRMALSEFPHPISVKRSIRNLSLEQFGNRRPGDSSAIAHLLDGRLRVRSPPVPRRKGAIPFVTHFLNDAYPGDYRTNVSNDVGRKSGRYAVGGDSTSSNECFRHLSYAPILPDHPS